MSDYRDSFSNIEIIKDETNGLVSSEAISRHGQDRKTKIKNNFTGNISKSDSKVLLEIVNLLNNKLPEKKENETVVGLITSGIIMSGYLAFSRGSKFNYSVYHEYGDVSKVFTFIEGHRDDQRHFLYGIKPGDDVIVVEDEVTSGKGVIGLTKALTEFGVNVIAIACVIETLNFDARKEIKENTGIDLISLVQIRLS